GEREPPAQARADPVADGQRHPCPDALRQSSAAFEILQSHVGDRSPRSRVEMIRHLDVSAPPLLLEYMNRAAGRASAQIELADAHRGCIAYDMPIQRVVGEIGSVARVYGREVACPLITVDDA